MLDDIEVEFENNQDPAADNAADNGSETQEVDEPVDSKVDEKQEDSADDSKDSDSTEDDSEDEKSEEKTKEKPDASKFDKDLDTWAEKAGHDKPENDRERALLQKLRNGSRDFTKDQQAKKSAEVLDKTLTEEKDAAKPEAKDDTSTPEQKRLDALEKSYASERTTRLRSEFLITNKVSDETGEIMAQIFKEKVAKAPSIEAKNREIEYWSDPAHLEDWLELAKAREANAVGKDQIVDEATRKERERIAKESRATGPNRNASKSNSAKSQDSAVDKLWKED